MYQYQGCYAVSYFYMHQIQTLDFCLVLGGLKFSQSYFSIACKVGIIFKLKHKKKTFVNCKRLVNIPIWTSFRDLY